MLLIPQVPVWYYPAWIPDLSQWLFLPKRILVGDTSFPNFTQVVGQMTKSANRRVLPTDSLNGSGGTGCDWCFAGNSFAPSQSVNASIFFISFDFVARGQIGGTHFGPGDISLGSSSITAGTFVFPKMRNVFTVSVPAAFDSTLFGQVIQSGQTFGLNIRPGALKLTFDFSSACGGTAGCYSFDHATFTTTPEPSTVLLSVTGLMLIAGRAWRKRNPV